MLRTITAMFDSAADAQAAQQRLRELGTPADAISIIDQQTAGSDRFAEGAEHKGLWASIKDLFLPDEDRSVYEEGLRRGGFLLTAGVEDERADEAIRALDELGPVDIDRR